ncbi:MAG: hypothetical protein ACE5I7_20260 [Candidatus Binatia bacterium]
MAQWRQHVAPLKGPAARTMWGLLERVAELERRAGALYERFGELFRQQPLVAAFWREFAADERMHALIVAAAREVFPASEPALPGSWSVQLAEIATLLDALEAKATAGLSLADAFAFATELEASELNTVTRLMIEHAGSGFSRLAPLLDLSGVDRHRDKVVEARRRFQIGEVPHAS